MNKRFYLLALLLLPCMAFAQTDLPFTSLKPFNKGNFKIDVSYSRLMQRYPSFDYPDFRVDVGYGITNWCVAGVFGSFGSNKGLMTVGGGYSIHDADTTYQPVVFDGTHIVRYFHYGIDVELHPLSLLLPNFYFIDMYCRGELGMRTVQDHYIPDYQDPDYTDITDRFSNDFLYGGSVGVAVNPSKYFGVFYELAYDNLNKKIIDYNNDIQKPKAIHRFGLNVRFPGPKKWQK
jgi:hypothetical protein